MAFKKIQLATIFQPVVVGAREAFSKFNVFPKNSSISLHDLFHATNDGFTS
jgi:hypothetical protein